MIKSKTLLFSAVLMLAASTSYAASPLDGAWKSNMSKSYWTNGPMPKGFSLTIHLKWTPSELEYHSVNDTNKSKPMVRDFVAKLDDTVAPLRDNARFNEVRVKRLDGRSFQVLEQKDGDVVVGQYWHFTEDGKSLFRWGVAKAPDGKSKAFREWFDKVK
jgi:hypothetical protein